MLTLSHVAKERWLSGILAATALLVIWLLTRRHPVTGPTDLGGGGLYTPTVPMVALGRAPLSTFTPYGAGPGDYSYLAPPSPAKDACGCGCDPLTGAASLIDANIASFAASMSTAERSYYGAVFGALPDSVKQFVTAPDGSISNAPLADGPGYSAPQGF